MHRRIILLLVMSIFFFINPSIASAQSCNPDTKVCDAAAECDPTIHTCVDGYSCQFDKLSRTNYLCLKDAVGSAFGKIQAPAPLADFLAKNPTGAGAISQFLSNLVVLIYSVAGIVLIFMLLWGAFEWMTSGGDKEKISSAQKRIINAIIGILLFAVAFAVIRILGVFTGFTFFR